ncbi:MAG: CDP-alcohol phosphatidyltransferase family protein, partial [Bacteroidetes bacterium]|nr:CDP-alcohol phosphatidyltransferase family protein [Bacteroidota bacterium]
MTSRAGPTYQSSIKSDVSDELINTYLLRPIAHQFVRLLYRTSVTPNQVTAASIVAGFASAAVFALGGPTWYPLAGLLVTSKDLLDSIDGQLARAKQMFSRLGRFLDSLGDIAVNLAVFGAVSLSLYHDSGQPFLFVLAIAGFLGTTLRVSYHVFYQTSFLHLQNAYPTNRVVEEVQQVDSLEDSHTRMMQRLYLVLYGWQDRLMVRIDQWSQKGLGTFHPELWYGDRIALRLSGFLGLGTELFILMIFSLFRELEWYLVVNVVGLNAAWACNIFYRKAILTRQLRR